MYNACTFNGTTPTSTVWYLKKYHLSDAVWYRGSHVIVLSVVVDPESILGTQMWEYTLNRKPTVFKMTLHSCSQVKNIPWGHKRWYRLGNKDRYRSVLYFWKWWQFRVSNPPNGRWEETGDPGENPMDTYETADAECAERWSWLLAQV